MYVSRRTLCLSLKSPTDPTNILQIWLNEECIELEYLFLMILDKMYCMVENTSKFYAKYFNMIFLLAQIIRTENLFKNI